MSDQNFYALSSGTVGRDFPFSLFPNLWTELLDSQTPHYRPHAVLFCVFVRTDDPPASKALLTALGLYDLFHFRQIYPGQKHTHFKRRVEYHGCWVCLALLSGF